MVIDNNEKERYAVTLFRAGDRDGAMKIQDEFVAEFRAYCDAKNDHCSCKRACKFHGKCKECVAIHRAHMDHLPNCFHPMINQRLQAVSVLTEHTLVQALGTE